MAITFVASSSGSGTTSASVPKPSAVNTGDVLVVFKGDRASSGSTTAPTGWTRLASAVGSGGRFEVFAGVFGKNSMAAGPWAFTGTTRTLGCLVAYRGVDNVNFSDVTPSCNFRQMGAASITTATSGCMILAAFCSLTSNTTWSQESLATNPAIAERSEGAYSTYLDIAICDAIKASTGATGASSGTMATSNYNAGSIVALRPARVPTVTTQAVTDII